MTDIQPPVDPLAKRQERSEIIAWRWVLFGMLGMVLQIPLNSVFGGMSVLFVLATAFALGRMNPLGSLVVAFRWLPVMGIGIMAVLSTIWSEAPGETFRIGSMTLVTAMIAIIMADRLSPGRFVLAVHCAYMVLMITALPTYRPGEALLGLTLSKNQLGYGAMVCLFSSAALTLDRNQRFGIRVFGLLSAPLCVLVLALSQAAGSLVAAGVGMVAFGFVATMRVLSPQGRLRALVIILVIGTPMIIARPVLVEAAHTFQEQVLHKDRTLTGRTYLWERAKPVIAARPILGHGYATFWRQGSLDAEGLWRYGLVTSRSGFNFHSEYVEVGVALGHVGVAVLILSMVLIALPLLVRSVLNPTIPLAFFTAFIAAVYLKASTEVGLMGAWQQGTIILYAAGLYGLRGAATQLSTMQARQSIANGGGQDMYRRIRRSQQRL